MHHLELPPAPGATEFALPTGEPLPACCAELGAELELACCAEPGAELEPEA